MIIKYFDLRQFAMGLKLFRSCLRPGLSQCQPTRELSRPFNHDSLCGGLFHCFSMNLFLQLRLVKGAGHINLVLQNRKWALLKLGPLVAHSLGGLA